VSDLAQKLCDALPHPATFNDYRYAQGTIERVRQAGLLVIDPDDEEALDRMVRAYHGAVMPMFADAWANERAVMRAALRAAVEQP
jgi:hypothetical protein